MAHEQALSMVNTIKMSWAQVARAIVMALKDGKVTPFEGMQLGMTGLQAATMLTSVFQNMEPAMRDELLYVLEHAVFAMPPTTLPSA